MGTIYYILGGGITFATLAFILVRYGEKKQQVKTLQANQEKAKEVKQIEAKTKKLNFSELRAATSKWVRKE
jgi:hypothetical protein